MQDNSIYLEALVKGNTKVINSLYQQIFPKVKKFIFQNKGQLADAEDIFQKALLQLAVRYKKEKFEIESSFEAYLFVVCKNLWRRELNKTKKEVTNITEVEPKDENHDLALAILEQKRWELFNNCLEQMSDNCKKILALFFSKTPYRTIMETFQYSSETVVRQRIFKCKTKLKKLIKSDHRYLALIEL